MRIHEGFCKVFNPRWSDATPCRQFYIPSYLPVRRLSMFTTSTSALPYKMCPPTDSEMQAAKEENFLTEKSAHGCVFRMAIRGRSGFRYSRIVAHYRSVLSEVSNYTWQVVYPCGVLC